MAILAAYFDIAKQMQCSFDDAHMNLDDAHMNLEVLWQCAVVLMLESSLPASTQPSTNDGWLK